MLSHGVMGQAPSSRHLRTVTDRVLVAPVLPSTRLDRAIRAPQAVLSRRARGSQTNVASQTDLAIIDEGWGNDEPGETSPAPAPVLEAHATAREIASKKVPSVRLRSVPRSIPVPRPLERLRGGFVPVLKLEIQGTPAIPIAESSAVAVEAIDILEIAERVPALRRIVVAPAILDRAATAAIARETTSVAGVPTLRELLAARAEARERELAERVSSSGSSGTFSSRSRPREAPVLFPAIHAAPATRAVITRDIEGERAIFALGTFVGALAVGISVLMAMLLK